MAEKVRHYLVKLEETRREDLILQRPTPWKVFLASFLSPSSFAFIVMSDSQLERFSSGKYAYLLNSVRLQSNGDRLVVHQWSLYNVIKFCIEGLQYNTFWRVWEWKWKKGN